MVGEKLYKQRKNQNDEENDDRDGTAGFIVHRLSAHQVPDVNRQGCGTLGRQNDVLDHRSGSIDKSGRFSDDSADTKKEGSENARESVRKDDLEDGLCLARA